MTISDLSDRPDQVRLDTEVCVIGAGMAGLLLAHRLSQAGVRTIVLESGEAETRPQTRALNEVDDPLGRYTLAVNGRRRGLGGSSSVWGGRMIPLTRTSMECRPYLELPAWPLEKATLDQYLPTVENLFRLPPGGYEADTGSAPCGFGLLRSDDDFTTRWAKWASYRRGNLADLLKSDLRHSRCVDIWLNATACDFTLDPLSGQVAAVVARSLNGRTVAVRANHFVLAAGTIESTRLLLHLARGTNDRLFKGGEILGRYFQDHLDADIGTIRSTNARDTRRIFRLCFPNVKRRSVQWEMSTRAQAQERVGEAYLHMTADPTDDPALKSAKHLFDAARGRRVSVTTHDFANAIRHVSTIGRFAYRRAIHAEDFLTPAVRIRLRACIEQIPQWSNRVTLSEKMDEMGVPRARLVWQPSPVDERTLRAAAARFDAYWRRAGMGGLLKIERTAPFDNFSEPVTNAARDYAHPSGTTRMGTQKTTSVVDPQLRCHDLPNLRIVSASVFPTAGSANPALTIMQLALYCADLLIRDVG